MIISAWHKTFFSKIIKIYQENNQMLNINIKYIIKYFYKSFYCA